ncbi:MAG TPA: gamma-glutamyltransferase [Gemmataceae bacterium]|nr:gamma-glutamyltransferase [Gemmataceae bacterium]
MTRSLAFLLTFALLLVGLSTVQAKQKQAANWHAEGKTAAVCVGGTEARDASLAMLKSGGNAADAAVVATLIISVTDSVVCFGGEVPIMYYDGKTQAIEVYSGQGAAPRLATQAHFSQKGIPSKGIEPAAIPGLLDALCTLLARRGSKTFAECAAPTLKILDQGQKKWHADLAVTFRKLIAAEKESPNDRVRGIRLVADYFYRGPLARDLDDWMKKNGGLIRYPDLATHFTRIEEPLSVDYRGYKVYKCGFWTQGPYFLEMLQMLEGYDLKKMGYNKPDTVHLMVETIKLGLADRDVWFADPLFADVPFKGLLSKEYATLRRSLIDMKKSSQQQIPGDPIKMLARLENPKFPRGKLQENSDTSTVLTIDQWGNAVAATPSGFDGVVAGKTGVVFGTRLRSFNAMAGHLNCIEPGKRPRITLSPGLVTKDGKFVLSLSCAGADHQDQQLIQYFCGVIDFGMHPKDFATGPRFGTEQFINSFGQAPPKLGNVILSNNIGQDVMQSLKERGANFTMKKGPWAAPVMIWKDPATGMIEAAGEGNSRRAAGAY